MNQLTKKELMYLEDEKSHEQNCINLYNDFSNRANDPQLKLLFSNLALKENEHLNTLTGLINGQLPAMNQNKQQQQNQQDQFLQLNQNQGNPSYDDFDKFLCSTALSMEKHVSSVYDTSIFEFKDKAIRDVLNHIQKEEQEHGQKIFDYMYQHGMYQLKF